MRTAVDDRIGKGLNARFVEEDTDLLQQTRGQLDDYFAGTRKIFSVPLRLVGTPFQQRVWEALLTVEYGTTTSYLQLSEKLGDKNAIRAVASANGANSISILVPCHRIIGSTGELVGYAGGLPAKRTLLMLENKEFGRKASAQMTLSF